MKQIFYFVFDIQMAFCFIVNAFVRKFNKHECEKCEKQNQAYPGNRTRNRYFSRHRLPRGDIA